MDGSAQEANVVATAEGLRQRLVEAVSGDPLNTLFDERKSALPAVRVAPQATKPNGESARKNPQPQSIARR